MEILFGGLIFATDAQISFKQRVHIASLEARIAARTLSASDQNEVATAVNEFSGQLFKLTSYMDDQESVDIADQLGKALNTAGWALIKPSKDVVLDSVIAGIVVYLDDQAPDSTRRAAKALVDALNAKHIAAKLHAIRANDPAAQLNVTVGIKP